MKKNKNKNKKLPNSKKFASLFVIHEIVSKLKLLSLIENYLSKNFQNYHGGVDYFFKQAFL